MTGGGVLGSADPFAAYAQLELARLLDDYRGWRDEAEKAGDFVNLDRDRYEAIRVVLDEVFVSKPQVAGRTWSFFRSILAQRHSPTLGQSLTLADACAADGYLALVANGLAPPIVALDFIDSPETYPRSRLYPTSRSLPIPLAFVPPHFLSCPWLLTALHHEIGHALYRDLSMESTLALAIAGAHPKLDDSHWLLWLEEITCDAIAIRLAGPAFVWSLASVLDRRRQLDVWDDSKPHPPAGIRLPLAIAMVEALGWPVGQLETVQQRTAQIESGYGGVFVELRRQVNDVAAVLMHTPLHTLSGTLAQHGPARGADAGVIEEAVATLLAARAPKDVPIRLAPSAAQLAILHTTDPPATTLAIDAMFRQAKSLPWVSSDAAWQGMRERVRTMAVPMLADDGRKVPPLVLLQRHQQIAFVGATHHQLATAIQSAAGQRAQPWDRLELFFTSDAALQRIGGDELVNKKQAAMDELRHVVARAKTWTMYELEVPYYFASYWDVDREDGRIHVSPYVWGQDIARCPAVDYVRGRAPSPAYLQYARGLEALRNTSRVLDSSDR
jgi:hypothetical protein